MKFKIIQCTQCGSNDFEIDCTYGEDGCMCSDCFRVSVQCNECQTTEEIS